MPALNPDEGKVPIKQLFAVTAGVWPNLGGNANLVPLVANGQVFVASDKQLRIFGRRAEKANNRGKK